MWSGGKDSALALWRARRAGRDVRWLLTLHDRDTGRVRFHATPVATIERQADAIGLELASVPTTWEGFDAALESALTDLRRRGCTGLVFGDIHLRGARVVRDADT